jgi:hypothetical protein
MSDPLDSELPDRDIEPQRIIRTRKKTVKTLFRLTRTKEMGSTHQWNCQTTMTTPTTSIGVLIF